MSYKMLSQIFILISFFFLTFFNIKCIKRTELKTHLYFKNYNLKKGNNKYNKFWFIGFHNKKYYLFNINKNRLILNKDIMKKNKPNFIYLQESEKQTNEFRNISSNEKDKHLLDKLVNKIINNKVTLAKYLLSGTFCIALFSLYKILLNKKIELTIRNIFKEKLLFINIPKRKHYFLSISLAEFRSSPLFFSTILIASYSLYIILKVYIEKYKEAKRIKSAIDAYNKNKNEYINTGIDSTNENDITDYFDKLEENNDFNKQEDIF
ncbi:conserved Plasmodium protein, unknown function [Plasmodium gallinaceum]|uniref:Uncharacterized protein n=1 Tax=Plasmodium gallinaceum TaxID=5849 RepID=A0A1J1GZ31_PLAGA|nr:conserved Plasmodium protein, unknown function [Plasmodium gallinaceum]CRG96275.1 conserved Plasmodium protein, unknown function [Plasmodium gallinaceum]